MVEYIDREELLTHQYNADREELLTHQYNASHSSWPQLAEMVVGVDGYKVRRACSVCGWDAPEYGKFYSYCPNYGAKMDLEVE